MPLTPTSPWLCEAIDRGKRDPSGRATSGTVSFGQGQCVSQGVPGSSPNRGALVALAVIWRNRLIHSLADNEVPDGLREQLLRSVDDIRNDYRGLDVERTILAAARGDAPTLKEATSVIAACHAFVAGIDAALLSELSVERYAKDVIVEHLSQAGRRNAREQLALLWGKDIDRHRRSIGQVLQSSASVALPDQAVDEWIGSLIEMPFAEALSSLLLTP